MNTFPPFLWERGKFFHKKEEGIFSIPSPRVDCITKEGILSPPLLRHVPVDWILHCDDIEFLAIGLS